MNNKTAKPMGNFHPHGAPYGIYRCKGDDEWISIAAITDQEWLKVVEVMGSPPYAKDERFSSRLGRVNNRQQLDSLIETWTKEYDKYDIEKMLMDAGVPTGIVADICDQFADSHLRSREAYVEIKHPILGDEIIYGNPIKLSDTPAKIQKAAPLLGQDNHYVFGQLLGLVDSEITELEKDGVLF